MAHHQGMTIVAIANALLDGAMRERFHAEPMVQATELLLQEGTPRDVAVVRPWAADAASDARALQSGSGQRRWSAADHRTHRGCRHAPAVERPLRGDADRMPAPATAAGEVWPSRDGGRMPPATTGAPTSSSGTSRSGDVWSAGFQPSGAEPDAYDVTFNEDRAELTATRRDSDHDTGGARLGRGRCRGPPRFDRQFRQPGARDRRDVLCRTRAGAAG